MVSALYGDRHRLLPPLSEAAVEHHHDLPGLFHVGLEVLGQRAAVPTHNDQMQQRDMSCCVSQATNSSNSHTRSVTPAAIAGVMRSLRAPAYGTAATGATGRDGGSGPVRRWSAPRPS